MDEFESEMQIRRNLYPSPHLLQATLGTQIILHPPRTPETGATESLDKGIVELREALPQQEKIIVDLVTKNHGDAILGIGLFHAFCNLLLEKGLDTPITILANTTMQPLLSSLASDRVSVQALKTPFAFSGGYLPLDELVQTQSEESVLYLDFAGFRRDIVPSICTRILQEDNGYKNLTVIEGVFNALLSYPYTVTQSGTLVERYANLIEDIFGQKRGIIDRSVAQTTLDIPDNPDMIDRFDLIRSPKQIACFIEASIDAKRYALSNWAEFLRFFLEDHPDYQVNFVYQQSYTDQQVHAAFAEAGINKEQYRIVHESLRDLYTLFKYQQAIVSNDSVGAHIAGTIPYGHPVFILFGANNPRPDEWISSALQLSIMEADNLTPEDKRQQTLPYPQNLPIQRIHPETISRIVSKALAQQRRASVA